MHHVLAGLLPGVHRWGHGHFLLDPSGSGNQHRQHKAGGVGFGQVYAQELVVEGGCLVDGHEGYPRVHLFGQPNQVIRVGEQGLDENPKQPDENGHLDNQRSQASQGADAGLLVHLHGFLGHPGPVAGVTLLHFLHLGLKHAHRPHLANLLQGKGHGEQPDQHRKHDDGDAHVVETKHVQHQHGVEHGPDDDFVPKGKDYFQGSAALWSKTFGSNVRVSRMARPLRCCSTTPESGRS